MEYLQKFMTLGHKGNQSIHNNIYHAHHEEVSMSPLKPPSYKTKCLIKQMSSLCQTESSFKLLPKQNLKDSVCHSCRKELLSSYYLFGENFFEKEFA